MDDELIVAIRIDIVNVEGFEKKLLDEIKLYQEGKLASSGKPVSNKVWM